MWSHNVEYIIILVCLIIVVTNLALINGRAGDL